MHYFNPWYRTEEGQFFLNATNAGQLMFMWEAVHRDGSITRMYEDLAFERALKDDTFVPDINLRRTVESLDRNDVREFRIIPIALTRKLRPMVPTFAIDIDLENDARFVSFWETDHVPKDDTYLRRTVIGIEQLSPKKGQNRFEYLVVSPSGKVMRTPTLDTSFEGE